LAHRAKERCKNYSKGMLQRLGLAQTLLHEPKLLILDEPTDGLDPQARAEMRQIIRRLKDDGVTIFLNSHLLQEVEMICQRVAILDRGEMRYCGTVESIGDHINTLAGSISEGIRLSLEVSGAIEAIENLMQNYTTDSFTRNEKNIVGLTLSVADQDEMDQLVDTLRANAVSIRRLSREQVTLEDAFLKLVSNQSNAEIVGARMDRLKK
jgi:ABC-2 type transport system ATP-binding protein